eukprot:Pompholyxophrys_sp_v1_NODE_181_length_1326_cov_4.434304.p1 type:complete len:168 gc:universal NODE_181_length_1326_cov_4.434304:766-1269(+)
MVQPTTQTLPVFCLQIRRWSQSAQDVDENLLNRVGILLQAINSSFPLDTDKFRQFSFDTATLFVSLYPWFKILSSVHKLWMHGHHIQKEVKLPVGILSEERAESCNKLYRKCREDHARKDSREHAMMDMFLRRMVDSDPKVSLTILQDEPVKKKVDLPEDVKALLIL